MRCKFWLTNRIFLLPFLCLALQAKPTDDLYTNISTGCVEILVGGRLDGSGVIVDTKGLVMTAFHVVRKKGKKMEALSHSLEGYLFASSQLTEVVTLRYWHYQKKKADILFFHLPSKSRQKELRFF